MTPFAIATCLIIENYSTLIVTFKIHFKRISIQQWKTSFVYASLNFVKFIINFF
jgi:hypothetical protein